MKKLMLLLLVFIYSGSSQAFECLYDSFMGNFLIVSEGQTFSHKARANFDDARFDCNQSMAVLYDGERLLTWIKGRGFRSFFDVSNRYNNALLEINEKGAAFYDGENLNVVTNEGVLYQERSVFKRVPHPAVRMGSTNFAFFDHYDLYIFDFSLLKFKIYSKVYRHSKHYSMAQLKNGLLLYDGLMFHTYCKRSFFQGPDIEMNRFSRVLVSGKLDQAMRVGDGLYTLDSDCKVQQLSGDYPEVNWNILNQ